ncbi:biopolymer transporter ExbD [Rhodobacteraceae bacterium LMO-12]|nr:biopolymer transporter ExbD [Rhodobacteraceae bacterium LMO-JJ12]
MDITLPKTKPRAEAILPMINVVFLLLIFFLMSAQLSAPEPVEIAPPHSEAGDPSEAAIKAFLDREGVLYFNALKGEAAHQALADALASAKEKRVELRADALAPAIMLTRTVARATAAGAAQVDIAVEMP